MKPSKISFSETYKDAYIAGSNKEANLANKKRRTVDILSHLINVSSAAFNFRPVPNVVELGFWCEICYHSLIKLTSLSGTHDKAP